MQPSVTVSQRGEDRLRAGHLWIYQSDVMTVRASGGDIVAVTGARGRRLGQALFSDRSQIALRLLTHGDEPVDGAFWRGRIGAALEFREQLGIDATAYRLVHGEGDLLPSLIVDRYGEHLVVQALSQGIDRALPEITAALVERLEPAGILARNDVKVRALEGLEQKVEVLHGAVPPTVLVREGPIEYDVDPWKGQKTGLFLDQRENRAAAAAYARGRLLDAFSYNGGFAMRLAATCGEVVAVDISAEATSRIAANAARNGCANIEAREANVFDELRRLEREKERFDTIVLDPPAFAKNKASVPKAHFRLPRDQPAGPEASCGPAATWSPAAALTTWTRRALRRWCTRRPWTRRRTWTSSKSACRGATTPFCSACRRRTISSASYSGGSPESALDSGLSTFGRPHGELRVGRDPPRAQSPEPRVATESV